MMTAINKAMNAPSTGGSAAYGYYASVHRILHLATKRD